jgi:hypothetical protein
MTRDSNQADAEVVADLIADVSTCCEKLGDVERRLRSLHERYVVDSPLVEAVAQVRSGQEAILEALQRVHTIVDHRRSRKER